MKFSGKTGKSELSMLTNIFVFDNIDAFIGQLAQLVEPLVYTQVVGSSSLSLPIGTGCSADGSALGLGPRCRRFDPCHPDTARLPFLGVFFYLELYFCWNKYGSCGSSAGIDFFSACGFFYTFVVLFVFLTNSAA